MCYSTLYSPGPTGYKSCYREMLKVVKGVIQEADEMEDVRIYAFSYYFDHAAEAGLVGEEKSLALCYSTIPIKETPGIQSNSYQKCNDRVVYMHWVSRSFGK